MSVLNSDMGENQRGQARRAGGSRDLCLWFVRPHDGRVKKLRLSYRRLSVIAVVAGIAGILCLSVAGDYARLQVLRLKNAFFLEKATFERDHLMGVRDTLQSEVERLKAESQRNALYEENVKAKLQELAAIVDASRSLGLPDVKALPRDRKDEGVGGAEVDCADGDADCSGSVEPMAMLDTGAPTVDEHGHPIADSQAELLGLLDNYIASLRAVPLAPPSRGHVSSTYGYRNSPFEGSQIKFHEGIDIALPIGSKVYATGDAVVTVAERHSTYGLVVDLQHTDRVLSRYAHLSKLLVRPGQHVTRGQVIGLAGSTGRSTGSHLHYEVRVDGQARNPNSFLALAAKFERLL